MNKNNLKVIVFSLAVILAVGFAVYRFITLNDDFEIDDAEARNALKWLRAADKGDFDDCRESAAAAEKWFDLFQKNRESLENLKSRQLRSKSIGRNGTYKIIFKSEFSKAPKIDEVVWISKDAKVHQVEYQYSRMPFPRRNQQVDGSPEEIQEVSSAISRAINAMKTLDVDFFNQVTLRGRKYKGGKRIVERLKKIFDQAGYPRKYSSPRIRFAENFPGKTEIRAAWAVVSCFYKMNGKDYRNGVFIVLYKNTSAAKPRWEIYRFNPGRIIDPEKLKMYQRRKNAKKK
ncbi:MAG: hypothetical protein WC082_11170 [Victivallales bacterium]